MVFHEHELKSEAKSASGQQSKLSFFHNKEIETLI